MPQLGALPNDCVGCDRAVDNRCMEQKYACTDAARALPPDVIHARKRTSNQSPLVSPHTRAHAISESHAQRGTTSHYNTRTHDRINRSTVYAGQPTRSMATSWISTIRGLHRANNSVVCAFTVAILAQGTHWASAAMQAFFFSNAVTGLDRLVIYCVLA